MQQIENLKLKILFLGTPSFVEPVREAIRRNFELVEDIKNADLIVVGSFGKILSKEELEAPKYGGINIHPSALPKFRGSSPIQTQILQGVKESSITFIKMDEEVDHGPILKTIPFEIKDDDTFESAAKRAFKSAADALPEVIDDHIAGRIKPIEQDHSKASYTEHLEKEDGYIDIDNPPSSEKLDKMIRAFYPWPGVHAKFKIKDKISKIVKFLPDKKIQVEGRNPMSYKDFVNGYPDGSALLKKLRIF